MWGLRQPVLVSYLGKAFAAKCDEISVRLMVIQHSDRARNELTVVAWYTLVPLAGGRVLLGACLQAPSQEVL